MYKFGRKSKERLDTCDQRLQDLMAEVIKYVDITIVCGHRTKEEQDKLYPKFSKVQYPNSKHNRSPSIAVDIAPYNSAIKGINWGDIRAFGELSEVVFREAEKLGLELVWGGDWTTFKDYPHYQIVEESRSDREERLQMALNRSNENNSILTERLKSRDTEVNRLNKKLEDIKNIIIT